MSIPEQMTRTAIRGGKGDADALHPETVATPRPAPGEILIRVRAAGVNRPDLLQRRGAYPPPPGAPRQFAFPQPRFAAHLVTHCPVLPKTGLGTGRSGMLYSLSTA